MLYPKRLAVWELVTDDDRINLFRVDDDTALAPDPDGLSDLGVNPEAQDRAFVGEESLLFIERAEVHLVERSVDALKRERDRLQKVARKAYQYRNEPARFRSPVYCIQKAPGETNPRYSLVHSIPAIEEPSALWSQALAQQSSIEGLRFDLARFIWRDQIPGQKGNAIELTAVGDHPAPAGLNYHHVGDLEQTDGAITHIFNEDVGVGFSANLVGTEHNIWPASPAVGDNYYIGVDPDDCFFHYVGRIVAAGVYSGLTWVLEYSQAAAWVAMTLGQLYTLYPDADPFNAEGPFAINFFGFDGTNGPAPQTVNGASRHWIRLRITGLTSMTTNPRVAADHVALRHSSLEIGEDQIVGTGKPYMMMRVKAPHGADETAGGLAISRLFVGAKSENLDTFPFRLNLGNHGNLAGWSMTYGTDASAVSAANDAPGRRLCRITFATDTTMVMRCRITGTSLLKAMIGEYRPLIRLRQNGGIAGDCSVKLRAVLGALSAFSPIQDLPEIALNGADEAYELANLSPGGYLKIPWLDPDVQDPDYDLSDIHFEIHAKRTNVGPTSLDLVDLSFLPTNEWSAEYVDPLSNPSSGSSALRGSSILEDDGGVIRDRTVKRIIENNRAIGIELWQRRGLALRIEPRARYRLYFVMGHYPSSGWGQPPLLSRPGLHAVIEFYRHNVHHYLRGDQ